MSKEFPITDPKEGIYEEVIKGTLDHAMLDANTKILINPTGRFVVGGPKGDSGLTGRKIIVNCYGGYGRHGGGAFSGKDPTKVDRSAAYAGPICSQEYRGGRSGGKVEPGVGLCHWRSAAGRYLWAETFGTGKVDDARSAEIVQKAF